MNSTATASTAALSKCAKLASWVEKPPMAMVAKAWPAASNGVMPAAQ